MLEAQGREVGGMYPESEVEERYSAGDFSPSAPVFGPLPPGGYRVAASAPGGLAASREVTLSGEAERSLKLDLAK